MRYVEEQASRGTPAQQGFEANGDLRTIATKGVEDLLFALAVVAVCRRAAIDTQPWAARKHDDVTTTPTATCHRRTRASAILFGNSRFDTDDISVFGGCNQSGHMVASSFD